jgi:hypothetical protein
VVALDGVNELHAPIKVKINESMAEINYEKVASFLTSHLPSASSMQHGNLPAPPEVKLKIGSTFIQMIGEYLERSKYLGSDKLIYITKIADHFEFILFVMYQLCVTDRLKEKLNTDIRSKIGVLESEKGE